MHTCTLLNKKNKMDKKKKKISRAAVPWCGHPWPYMRHIHIRKYLRPRQHGESDHIFISPPLYACIFPSFTFTTPTSSFFWVLLPEFSLIIPSSSLQEDITHPLLPPPLPLLSWGWIYCGKRVAFFFFLVFSSSWIDFPAGVVGGSSSATSSLMACLFVILGGDWNVRFFFFFWGWMVFNFELYDSFYFFLEKVIIFGGHCSFLFDLPSGAVWGSSSSSASSSLNSYVKLFVF